VRRIELGDFLLIAEIHTGIDANQLARIPRVLNRRVGTGSAIRWIR
jgi:hypothetical protein